MAVVYEFTSTTIYCLWDLIFLPSILGPHVISYSTETRRAITDIEINVP